MNLRRTHFARRRRGVGLVELLVALSIGAALLTATAVAVNASFKAYAINQELGDLNQRSRLTMYRITAMIRQTKLHAPHTASVAAQFAAGKTVTDTGIDMFDLNDQIVSYRYDPSQKQLLVVVGGKSHVMCEGVEAFSMRMEPMRSATSIRTGGSWDLLRRATLLLTVTSTANTATKGEGVGKQRITLSAIGDAAPQFMVVAGGPDRRAPGGFLSPTQCPVSPRRGRIRPLPLF